MKTLKILAALIIAIWAIGYLSLSNISRINPSSPMEEQALDVLEESGCILCHSKDSPPPFYAHIPIVGYFIDADMQDGLRHFDIAPTVSAMREGAPSNETALSKIEFAVRKKTMPPLRFSLFHWPAKLTSGEKSALIKWIAAERAKLNAGSGIAEKFSDEPVWPVSAPSDIDARKARLGSILYHHKALSGDETVSCATCHPLDNAGTDGLQTSTGIRRQKGEINAPTVYNAVFNIRQFWDGRASDLRAQAGGPPMNPVEMDGGSWKKISDRLEKDAAFAKKFKEAYPEGFSEKTITDAIAEFEKTLVTTDAPFDKYLRGEDNAIPPEAARGYALFKEIGCASCHSGRNLGGQTFEYMGLKADYFKKRGDVGNVNDRGLVSFTQDLRDARKFKTPTLRNVALTAPYFHDGSTENLKQAVETMSEFQSDKKLTGEQIDELVMFLESLTGKCDGEKLEGKKL